MTLAILTAPLMWGLWIVFGLVAQLIGFPLIAVLALFPPRIEQSPLFDDKRELACFAGSFWLPFLLWENWEDGIDGIPLINNTFFKNQDWIDATKTWSRWRRIWVWSAWRNSVNNQRYAGIFRLVVDPNRVYIRYFFNKWAYFVWQGVYSALYLTVGSRYIFIGYKIHQTDLVAIPSDDTRLPGAGFSFDFLKKADSTSWQYPVTKLY